MGATDTMRFSILFAAFLILTSGCITAGNVQDISTTNACNFIRAAIGENRRALLLAEIDRRGIFPKTHHAGTKVFPMARAIREQILWRGMTEEQLRCARGFPRTVNRSVGSWGIHKQWVFGASNSLYVYTENGFVTSWQD